MIHALLPVLFVLLCRPETGAVQIAGTFLISRASYEFLHSLPQWLSAEVTSA